MRKAGGYERSPIGAIAVNIGKNIKSTAELSNLNFAASTKLLNQQIFQDREQVIAGNPFLGASA
jgi:hypothetical protein